MNVQEQMTEQQTKLAAIRSLLSRDLSVWTPEEINFYGNKESASIERDLILVSIQLLIVEELFEKGFDNWSSTDKDRYGNEKEAAMEQLRKEKEQLRKKEDQLRKKEEQLREQQTILLRMKGKKPEPVEPALSKKLTPKDSAIELSTLDPKVQSTVWKSVVRISCDEFIGSGLVIDRYDDDVKNLGGGRDKSLYILTNLHLLGNDKDMMERVSYKFKEEITFLEKIGKVHGKRNTKRKIESQDPLKVRVEQLCNGKLVFALDFILEKEVCWWACFNSDMMIFKVPIPHDCSLEKSDFSTFYCDTMPVHIFGFPGVLAGDVSFHHDYAIIPAQITGKDDFGHLLFSTLSTPGLSGSAIVCTGRGTPIGYLGGGFDSGGNNQQYQCYGYSFMGLPLHLPRFLQSQVESVE